MTDVRKTCSRCEKSLPANTEFFQRNASTGDGFRAMCKVCQRKPRAAAKVDPLKSAYDKHAKAAEKRAEHQERAALIEENKSLKSKLTEIEKMGAPRVQIIKRAGPTRGDAVACALASDWHVEEPVESAKVHGLNEFNLEIAEVRSQHFFRNFLRLSDMMARETKVKTLWLGLLGDFFSNYIHDELKQVNELAPGAAAKFVLGLLSSGIDFLLKESSYDLDIDAVPGNHGRMSQKPQISNATETSLETFMFHALAGRYTGNARVRMRVASSKMLYRRYFERFTMRVIHGDDVKFGGGIGGITIPIRKKLAAWDKSIPADLTVMGHFHQLMDGGDFLVNGSLIGFNEFAQAIGASPEEARQAFFLIHARNGGEKSITAPIWLDQNRRSKA